MTCNTTVRNNLANGLGKRGSAAIDDDSRTGCCDDGTIELRYEETRMDALYSAGPTVVGRDPPKQRHENDRRRFSVSTSAGGVAGGEIGTEGMGIAKGGRTIGEPEEGQSGQAIEGYSMGEISMVGQSMGGHSMGGQNMGGQSMGGQSMGGQSLGGQSMGGQSMGGQSMGGQSMGVQSMGGQSMGEQGGMGCQRKLILHFDIRNTILVADSVTQVKVEQALNTFLTGVTWGKEADGEWVWLSETPSLRPPCDGAITYYKHLERQLAQAPDDRALLRQATGDFTQVPLGKKFRPYFEERLRRLQWNHEVADKLLTMVGSDDCHYHYLLPSFIRLLYKLQADGRDFAVVLRTYGMDVSNVLACLQHIVAGNHPEFGRRLPIEVRRNPGRIRRHEDGRIEFEVRAEGNDAPEPETETTYSDELQIYRLLSGSHGISGFVDDFFCWQRNSYRHRAGKPFWIDLEDDAVQHIFFDDNIRVTAEDSIVDVRLAASADGRGGFDSVDLARMSAFENACLVQADLLESISNVDYFVEKVRTCERNYARLTCGIVPLRSLDSNAA